VSNSCQTKTTFAFFVNHILISKPGDVNIIAIKKVKHDDIGRAVGIFVSMRFRNQVFS